MVSADSAQTPPWHTRDADELARALGTDPEVGLSHAAAERGLSTHGRNEIRRARRRGPLRMFLDQFTDFMILVLIAAAVVSGVVGDPVDTIAILVIVILNAVIGFIQEYRAERAVAALRQMAAPEAKVIRNGERQTIPATHVVPGDVVVLEAGDVMPADMRLVETAELQVDESALTGESQPVSKSRESLDDPELPIGDRTNMGHKGTLITRGRGRGLVVATGMATELGNIAELLHKEEAARTPLQRRLARFGQRLAVAVLLICALIFVAGLLRGEPVVLMFLTAVSLAVAAIPEALPAVVTVSLALGARKMVRKQALIRRLPAVETLGSVTFICADKTGTLTKNRMRLELTYAADQRAKLEEMQGPPWETLLTAMALNNDATVQDGELRGDPTEVALAEAAEQTGYRRAKLEDNMPREAELPFDAERKRMSTIHRDAEGVVAFTKGGPEPVLERCKAMLTAEGERPIDSQSLLAQAEALADEGYRVLAYARRRLSEVPAEPGVDTLERDLTFLGFAALMDPPRAEAYEAVELCRSAGITPVMVTGDHPGTARAIAARLGIADQSSRVVTGAELAEGATAGLGEVHIYARVNPEQKIDIVRALQDQGQFVAMTGDGVNDAPALKRADIGVAMGQKGTDVAREAADMVLLDDNFATIVTAVREGRRIYDNIRKFVKYTMTSNAGEIWTLFLAPFLGLPIPLLPIHILWINLVTDGLPGLALAAEPEERGVMQRPPRPPQETMFAHGMWQHILWVGVLIGGLSILTQAWAIDVSPEYWQTMVFTVLTLSQLVHVLVIRSERDSLLTLGVMSNRPLLGAIALTLLLQLATIYVPVLNPIFKTTPLPLAELLYCLAIPWLVFVAVEIEKWMVRQGWIYQENGATPQTAAAD